MSEAIQTTPIIRAGDILKCVSGHAALTAVRDIFGPETVSPAAFRVEDGTPAKKLRCPRCSGIVVRYCWAGVTPIDLMPNGKWIA